MPDNILETSRLSLRELRLEDKNFILDLLNTPSWLRFIGDKNVHTLDDAEAYLINGPLESYRKNGFGLWLVLLKEHNKPIGMCGLIKRDYLDDIDIGFALMPGFEGLGYGYEMAKATTNYGQNVLKISRLAAITDADNVPSIELIKKIGLRFEKMVITPEGNSVQLYSRSW